MTITVSVTRARIGFFLNNSLRWSIEPAAGVSYPQVQDAPDAFAQNLEVGALHHFPAPSSLNSAARVTVAYVRRFCGLVGVASGSCAVSKSDRLQVIRHGDPACSGTLVDTAHVAPTL